MFARIFELIVSTVEHGVTEATRSRPSFSQSDLDEVKRFVDTTCPGCWVKLIQSNAASSRRKLTMSGWGSRTQRRARTSTGNIGALLRG